MVDKLDCIFCLFEHIQKPLIVQGRMVEKLDRIVFLFEHMQKPSVSGGRMVKKLNCIVFLFESINNRLFKVEWLNNSTALVFGLKTFKKRRLFEGELTRSLTVLFLCLTTCKLH